MDARTLLPGTRKRIAGGFYRPRGGLLTSSAAACFARKRMRHTHEPAAPLFANTQGKVRADARTTSKAAAITVGRISGEQRKTVFECIKGAGAAGCTDQEVERRTGIPGSSVRPRRGELVAAEAVIDSGTTRPTASGGKAVVWVARVGGNP